jgi:hypothetical protein
MKKSVKKFIWSRKVMASIVVAGAMVSAGVFGLSGYFGGGEQGVPEDTWTRGLVAAYNFDEGSGDTLYNAAATGSVNDGTLMNNPTWTTGAPAGDSPSHALEFDGTDDYVDCGNDSSLDITDAITIEAWVKPAVVETGDVQRSIVTKRYNGQESWQFVIWQGKIYYSFWTGGVNTETQGVTVLSSNTWYHLVIIYDGANVRLYLNAVQDKVLPHTGDIDVKTGDINIGVFNSDTDYFNGAIDEVKIYNRALSAEEVRYHYNRGGPVAHWGFDEGAGVNVYNSADTSAGSAGYPISAGLGNRIPAQYDGSIKSSALDFITDDYVDCGSDDSLDITDAITIEAWVKAISGAGIITKMTSAHNDGWNLYLSSGGIRSLIGHGAGYAVVDSDSSTLNDGNWHHAVLRITISTAYMFIDGVLQADTESVDMTNCDTPLAIGRKYSDYNDYYFDGTIDEVRIYNKALHATTIANHYKGDYGTYEKTTGGADLTSDDLVLYIPFDDAAGDTATNYGSCGGVAANCNGDLTNYTAAEEVAKYGDTHDTGWVIDTDFTKARHNTGLEFGGVNGFFQSDSYIPAASSTSYSLWFKSSNGTYSANEYLFSQGNDDPSAYILATTGNIKVMAEDAVLITSAATVLDTKWHHIETTADGTNMRLYIDGVLDGTAAYTGSSDDAGISAGAHTSRSGFFDGIIDDLKVYAYARSPGEIRLDYNAGFAARMGPAGMTCSEDPASCMDYGLVASYDFDEGDGQTLYNAADTGSANDGTLGSSSSADSADPTWIASEGGSRASASGGGPTSAAAGGTALSFDGSNDYVNCGNDPSLNITDAITIEAWVKYNGGGFIVSKYVDANNRWDLYIGSSYTVLALGSGSSYSEGRFTFSLVIGEWYHIVGLYDGSNVKLYKNGVEGEISQSLDTIASVSADVLMGERNSAYFNGSIDGVKIYNRALSAEEIRYHYNRGGPVAHWRMDEGEGSTAYDESTNNNDGTLHLGSLGNTATSSAWVAGKHSSAIDFDGEDDYVDCGSGSSLDITDAITIEAWVKYNSTNSTHQEILCQDDSTNRNFEFLITDADKPMLSVYKSGSPINGYDSTALTDGVWYHLVGIFDGTQVMLYKNGVLGDNVNNVAAPIDSDPVNTSIGQRITVNDRNFNGTIDDVRIYDYARTPAQIQMDYNAGLATHFGGSNQSSVINEQCSSDPASCMDHGLVASYDFDEGDGQTLYNAADTGSVNDGTLGSSSSADSADPTWIASEGGSRASASGGGPTSAAAGGSALQFDGTNDYVNCGNDPSLNITDAITIEAWVKIPSGTTASCAILGELNSGSNTSLQLVINRKSDNSAFTGGLYYYSRDEDDTALQAGVDTDIGIVDGNWHHLVSISEASSNIVRFYLDGSLLTTVYVLQQTPDNFTSYQYPLTIGARNNRGTIEYFFNGSIDNVKIYNRALSAEEVRYHYNRGGPVAHWRMDEGEGSIAYDESSNNNDGTLHLGSSGNTATSTAWVAGKHGSAIDFDGDDDYVNCGNDTSLQFTAAGTVEMWVKPETPIDTYGRFIDSSGIRMYMVRANGILRTTFNLADIIDSTSAITTGEWQHWAMIHDGTTLTLYINGQYNNSGAGGTITAVSTVYLGTITADRYPYGAIDGVRIYNYARTPAQILMDYNAGFGAHLK